MKRITKPLHTMAFGDTNIRDIERFNNNVIKISIERPEINDSK